MSGSPERKILKPNAHAAPQPVEGHANECHKGKEECAQHALHHLRDVAIRGKELEGHIQGADQKDEGATNRLDDIGELPHVGYVLNQIPPRSVLSLREFFHRVLRKPLLLRC